MYNILLVDDEKLVIKSLQATVNWAKYGFQVAGFALSAQEALEKLEQLKPQVVITDIKMPHTTGLDLLRQIKQRAPDPYCMVISGYAEFEYAQQALSMEAVGYCLKPFDAEEIGRYLERIRQRLDEDWRRDLDHIRLLDAVQSSSEHALQYMDQIYREKAIDFKTDTIFAVFANHLPSLTWLNSPLTFWAGYHKAIGFCSQACLEQFEQQIKLSSDKTSLHVGVSRQICGPEQVAAAIREARRCAYQVFCHQSPGTGLLTRAGTCTDNLVLLVELDRILGQDAVEAQPGQATSANWQALLERLLRRITADFMQNQNSIDYTLRIHHIYNKWLIRHNSEQAGEIADYEAMAEAYPNVYAMLDEIQASYAAWAAAPVSRPVAGALSNETFKNIYQYLVNHYNQNISLTYLADLFHVNPCYISQMFRKNLDCTLVEFLNQQRIDQAALLLRTSGSKIAQIAEDVGFNDYFYFSRVFRKIMHCSPSEYRSRTTGPKPS